jgi:hypothetical protein
MIRIIIFVLITTSAWCQTRQETFLTSSTTLNPEISRPRSSASYIKKKYKRQREKYIFGGFTTSVWIPSGNSRILGSHPSLGLVMGKWSDQWLWEFEMEFRFLRAPHDYKVVYQDTLQSTHYYLGGFIGLHFGYGIINFKRTSIYVMGGFGYDGFDAISGDDTDQNPGMSINSFNLNTGICRRYLGHLILYFTPFTTTICSPSPAG